MTQQEPEEGAQRVVTQESAGEPEDGTQRVVTVLLDVPVRYHRGGTLGGVDRSGWYTEERTSALGWDAEERAIRKAESDWALGADEQEEQESGEESVSR